jgi:hypothetical protein
MHHIDILRSLALFAFALTVFWLVYVVNRDQFQDARLQVSPHSHPATARPTQAGKAVLKPVSLIQEGSFDAMSLAAVVPVSEINVEDIQILLSHFLKPCARIREVVIVCPDAIRSRVQREIRKAVTAAEEHDHPEILLRSWGTTTHQIDAVFHAVSHVTTAWLLLLDHRGLRDVDNNTLNAITGWEANHIPYGPIDTSGATLLRSDMSCTSALEALQSSPPLSPPILIPMALFMNLVLTPVHDVWALLKHRLLDLLSATDGNVGKQSSPAEFSWCTTTTPSLANDNLTLNPAQSVIGNDVDVAHIPLPLYQAHANNTEPTRRTGYFAVILSSLQELDAIAPVLCKLVAKGHQVRTLITTEVETSDSQNPHVSSEPCRLHYDSSTSETGSNPSLSSIDPLKWLVMLHHWPDVILVEEEYKSLLYRRLQGELKTTLIGIPHADLPYSDWMGTMSIKEWQRESMSM